LERSKVAIVIPCYNEEKTILKVIFKVTEFGTPIIVNDCSSDKSLALIENIKEKVIIITNNQNLGYEKSLQLGFETAYKKNFKYVITFDADNQFKAKDIGLLIENLKDNQIVIGERVKFQRFSEHLFSFFFYIFYKIKDPLSGLKLYKINLFKENNCIFDSKNLIGTELLIKAIKNKQKISMIKVKTTERKDLPRYGGLLKANTKILLGLIKAIFFLKVSK
jgi:glycosyltransferase involved in cell wall biosynthesis